MYTLGGGGHIRIPKTTVVCMCHNKRSRTNRSSRVLPASYDYLNPWEPYSGKQGLLSPCGPFPGKLGHEVLAAHCDSPHWTSLRAVVLLSPCRAVDFFLHLNS